MASHDIRKAEPVPSQFAEDGVPNWVHSTNRTLGNRWVKYGAALLLVIDGVTRLADGRVLRGLANLGFAVAILLFNESWADRRYQRKLAEDAAAGYPERWIHRHPVLAAVALGGIWGAAMSVFLIATREGPIVFALIVGLGIGVLFFGPLTVWMTLRARKRAAAMRAANSEPTPD